MSRFWKNILWAVSRSFFISLLFSLFAAPAKAPATLSLNQLVDKINAGQVSKISVNGGDLAITMKDGSQAVAENPWSACIF